MMDLYGNGLLLGEKTLDSLWMRQNLTMNNIANVDTPGFKSQYMTFENELAQKNPVCSYCEEDFYEKCGKRD